MAGRMAIRRGRRGYLLCRALGARNRAMWRASIVGVGCLSVLRYIGQRAVAM